ncbi:MAG: hypothetical protein ACODAA_04955 [Gemmatimonadota bacterium]
MTPSRRNTVRQRKAWWIGFALSAAFHAFLLFGWRTTAPQGPGSLAAGPRAGDVRAASGGSEMTAIDIRMPQPIEVPEPPTARPLPSDPQVAVPQREVRTWTASLSSPTGSALDPGHTGSGLPRADGAGDAGADRRGRDRNAPPTPRSITPRWDPPQELKGRRVTFRVRVDELGEPTGEIEVRPRLDETEFVRRVRDDLLTMDYLPGRRDGRPVSDWAVLTLTF